MTAMELERIKSQMREAAEATRAINLAQDARIENLMKALSETAQKMDAVIDIYESLRGAMRVLGWVQRIAAWVASIAAVAAVIHEVKK